MNAALIAAIGTALKEAGQEFVCPKLPDTTKHLQIIADTLKAHHHPIDTAVLELIIKDIIPAVQKYLDCPTQDAESASHTA